jgi:hypothetical protein
MLTNHHFLKQLSTERVNDLRREASERRIPRVKTRRSRRRGPALTRGRAFLIRWGDR